MPCDMMKDWSPELQQELDEALARGDKNIILTGKYKYMPCNESKGEIEFFEEKYGTRNPDKLRDMLCFVLSGVIGQGLHISNGGLINNEIYEWYEKHKKWNKDTSK